MSQKSINDFCTEFYALSYEHRKGTLKPSRTFSNARVALAWGHPDAVAAKPLLGGPPSRPLQAPQGYRVSNSTVYSLPLSSFPTKIPKSTTHITRHKERNARK